MTKRRLAAYGLNLVGVALLYALITLAFTFNAFGKSTTYIQGICTTACYTIIMVTSLNLVVGFMGEFSMGHAGFVSVGAYVSAIVSGALAGHGLSDLALLLVAILAGGLAAGIMGVAVAAFILWSGWGLVMDTLSPLLGESPSPELVEHIEQTVMGYPGVLGMHDLMVHDYGPGHQFASLHIEFPAETDPLKAHDVIDNIENDFIKRDGLQVTIHYDPIVTTDAAVGVLRTRLMEKARQLDPCLSIHDLRIVPGDTHTNVLFDLEFPAGYTGNKDEMLAAMCQFVHEQDPKYSCVVKVEQSYASAAHEK